MNTPTLKVKTTRPAITRDSRVILPAGSIGQVIQYERKRAFWFVDFGLLNVVVLPVDSSLIELVNGGVK